MHPILVFLFLIILAAPVPAWAQSGDLPDQEVEAALTEERELILPLTQETAQQVALDFAPGAVVAVDSYKDEDDFYYEFTIIKENGTETELDINVYTAKIVDIRINALGPAATMPPAKIKLAEAKQKALQHIEERTTGFRPKIRESLYTLVDRKPVYSILVKKGSNEYRVLVDANFGDIISSKRED